jgi:hypothetical protein
LRLDHFPVAAQGQRANLNPTPGLASVIDVWPTLPEPVRADVLALVEAASGEAVGR